VPGRRSIEQQLTALLAPGWVRDTPDAAFGQLPKYVNAAGRRARRLRDDVRRDQGLEAQVQPYAAALQALERQRGGRRAGPETGQLRWMIEEFRLSLFAQELRTLGPVSAKRLDAQLAKARAETTGG